MTRFLGLTLNKGVSNLHILSFLLASMLSILMATFMPQIQPYLLTEFLKIPETQQGVVSGNLNFWGEIAIILTVGFFGALSDKIGRRWVMVIGFCLIAFGVGAYPYAENLNELLLYRIVYSCGFAAVSCALVTLVADYVSNESRGKAAGYQGMMNGVGALITVFLLLRLPAMFESQGMTPNEAGHLTYFIVLVVIIAAAIMMALGLKKSEHHERSTVAWYRLLQEGVKAGKNPTIALAYGAAFVSRGNIAIVGTFFSLWIANHGTLNLGMSRADALAKAGLTIGIAQSFALFAAPFFGYLADRINRYDALSIALAFAAVGYSATYFITDPFSLSMLFVAAIIGISETAGIITSGVLIAQHSEEKYRGAIIGVFNLCGAFGILVASKYGGWLFDNWKAAGPFVLFGVCAFIVLIWSRFVRAKRQNFKPEPILEGA